MKPLKTLYGRTCRSPIWLFEVGESNFLVPKILHEATETVIMIRDRLDTAYIRQKSYADNRKRDLKLRWLIKTT